MSRRAPRLTRRSAWRIASFAALGIAATIAVALAQRPGPGNAALLSAVAPSGAVVPTRSPRNANYTIEARLDPATRALSAAATILWRNISNRPTSELQFHAYWNAWRDTRSTFLRESRSGRSRPDGDFARFDITSLTASMVRDAGTPTPAEDLTSSIAFIAPDDGNAEDRTVIRVPIPWSIEPGQSVRITVTWTARVPRTFARTGTIGRFFFIAQWFPKLGVLEDAGWNCHQFHASTEFFSDFGVYDVSLTVPEQWTVGATGVERSQASNGDGTTTHRFYQEDVHDFAWTTSPDFIVRTAEFVPSGPAAGPNPGAQSKVVLRLLIQPEHENQSERHFAAARSALDFFSQWFGPYPYGQLTIVDPAFQSDADGMEYPTLVTAGTRWLTPDVLTPNTVEEAIFHEIGHQFFYGIVANNETEDAWLDEGVNTYASIRAMAQHGASYFETRFFDDFVPWTFKDFAIERETFWDRLPGYRRDPKSDVPSVPSYRQSVNGLALAYAKTALWLNTLERMLGWPVMQRALATYFDRWQFKHPKPADFFAVINEVSGRDLTWFFDQVYQSSNVFDYAIESLSSRKDGDIYKTEVIARRVGEAIFPVDVAVVFGDGERHVESWDGRDRSHRYVVAHRSAAVSAQVDPDRVLLLDVNYTNNSRTLAPRGDEAANKWALHWLGWLQNTLLSWALFG